MAMLRVSSYRRLFEEEQWRGAAALSLRCGGQYHSFARGGATGGVWQDVDFKAARALNREGVSRFLQERTLIAALNDRLISVIEAARCLEEENECLESQVEELEGSRSDEWTVSRVKVPDCSLEAAVERLRMEKEEILCDITKLQQELEYLQTRHREVAEQKAVIELARDDVALDVDAVTTECLALRDQVAVYEEQLASMQESHKTKVDSLVEPQESVALVALDFPSPDVTPVIQEIKEYYSELAESLQYESEVVAVIAAGEQRRDVLPKALARTRDVPKVKDVGELRGQVAELQKELAELQKHGDGLEEEMERTREAHLEKIAELECCVAEMEDERVQLDTQMRDQCGDYDELLSEKMALDIEITAYRGLVEEEEERLCYL